MKRKGRRGREEEEKEEEEEFGSHGKGREDWAAAVDYQFGGDHPSAPLPPSAHQPAAGCCCRLLLPSNLAVVCCRPPPSRLWSVAANRLSIFFVGPRVRVFFGEDEAAAEEEEARRRLPAVLFRRRPSTTAERTAEHHQPSPSPSQPATIAAASHFIGNHRRAMATADGGGRWRRRRWRRPYLNHALLLSLVADAVWFAAAVLFEFEGGDQISREMPKRERPFTLIVFLSYGKSHPPHFLPFSFPHYCSDQLHIFIFLHFFVKKTFFFLFRYIPRSSNSNENWLFPYFLTSVASQYSPSWRDWSVLLKKKRSPPGELFFSNDEASSFLLSISSFRLPSRQYERQYDEHRSRQDCHFCLRLPICSLLPCRHFRSPPHPRRREKATKSSFALIPHLHHRLIFFFLH